MQSMACESGSLPISNLDAPYCRFQANVAFKVLVLKTDQGSRLRVQENERGNSGECVN